MAINKVIFGDDTLIDLTGDTVTQSTLMSGVTAHDAAGNSIEGTLEPVMDVKVDGTSVVDDGVAEIDLSGKADVGDSYTKSESDDKYLTEHQSLANYYTKTQVDTAVSAKANSSDVYTKTQADAKFLTSHQSLSNYYTKSEVDSLLNTKASKATTLAGYGITDAYTKTEVNNLECSSGEIDDLFEGDSPDPGPTPPGPAQDYYTKDEIDDLLDDKQGTLVAGSGITISGNTISATGGGSVTDDHINDLIDAKLGVIENGSY